MVSLEFFIDIILPFNSVSNINEYIYCGFKTSSDAFRFPHSIAFDCSIRPFLYIFHSWLCMFHLSRFFWSGLVFSFLHVSS